MLQNIANSYNEYRMQNEYQFLRLTRITMTIKNKCRGLQNTKYALKNVTVGTIEELIL